MMSMGLIDITPASMTQITARLPVRVGDGRVLYEVTDDALVVLVIRVRHRRESYRRR